MSFLLALAWRIDKTRLLVSASFMLVGYLSTPFIGLLLKGFTDTRHPGWAFGVALLLVFELMMVHFAHLYYFELGEMMAVELDGQLVRIANGSPGLSHFDDAEFADELTLARQDVTQTRPALEGILHLGGHSLRALTTTILLATVNPWLALLPLAAIPPVLISRRSHELIDRARKAQAERNRLTQHLISLATSADAVKEIRLSGAAPFLTRVQLADWEYESAALARAQLGAAALRSSGQLLFALAYGGAILLALQGTLGEIILVVTLAVQISLQVAAAIGLATGVQAASKMVARLHRLRTTPSHASGTSAPPARLADGIRLEDVSFAYPNGRSILDGVSLHIPAGSSVALVGENGAGKSSLVKLLCGFYPASSGRITLDGVSLGELDASAYRERVAFLFQDFARFELRLRDNVGTGDLAALERDPALRQALADARFTGTAGLDDFVGHSYADGAEMSGGQWQQAGLARTLLRRDPLILALDEPAAALDAQAESALFERFVESAHAAARRSGAITLFTSHRFSTVRMADLIVVLDQGRITEHGTHDELMAAGGLYAELFTLQARAYA